MKNQLTIGELIAIAAQYANRYGYDSLIHGGYHDGDKLLIVEATTGGEVFNLNMVKYDEFVGIWKYQVDDDKENYYECPNDHKLHANDQVRTWEGDHYCPYCERTLAVEKLKEHRTSSCTECRCRHLKIYSQGTICEACGFMNPQEKSNG